MNALRPRDLPREQREDHFEGKAAAVDEIAVEDVGIVLGGVSVDAKDVEQIVELAVHVPADRIPPLLRFVVFLVVGGGRRERPVVVVVVVVVVTTRQREVDQRSLAVQDVAHSLQDLDDVSFVHELLVAKPLHARHDEVVRHVINDARPVVGIFDGNGLHVDDFRSVVLAGLDGRRKGHLLRGLLALLELVPRVPVVRAQLADGLEVAESEFVLADGQVRGPSAVVSLDVRRVQLNRLLRVRNRQTVRLQLDVGHRPIREKHGQHRGLVAAFDGRRVHRDRLSEVPRRQQLVGLRLEHRHPRFSRPERRRHVVVRVPAPVHHLVFLFSFFLRRSRRRRRGALVRCFR
mmetsp:Transcript_8156/g.25175  ORF Transcript_8156/g.25175 Transcript_8156/m.25175 type:complete len:347 (+) Transcript_8156:949-1989(+)